MRVVRLRSARLISAAALLLISVNCTRAQEQSNLETLGGLLGLGNTAIQGFGEAGETLKNFAKDDFVGAGTGSLKRGLARGWNEALQPLKDAAQSVRERLSFKIADKAFQVADWAPPLGALSGGDVRGSVSGATQVLVGGTATGTGAAFFGAVGTGAGAVVGSFFPVVGNLVGAEIGGAIGTVAGGLISSYGYDKYLKDYVGAGVEGGFAAVFDVDPLKQSMQARQVFLHQNLSPEVADQLKTSLSFGGGEAQVLDWERVPYAIIKPQQPPQTSAPPQATPSPQDQAALTTGNVLAGVRKFSIGNLEWEINGSVATHRHVYPGGATSVVTARGTVSPNRIEGTMEWRFPGDPCHIRSSERFIYVFDAENVSGKNDPGPVEVRAGCKGWDKMTRGMNFTVPWRKTE